jgi:hypothetical protein
MYIFMVFGSIVVAFLVLADVVVVIASGIIVGAFVVIGKGSRVRAVDEDIIIVVVFIVAITKHNVHESEEKIHANTSNCTVL